MERILEQNRVVSSGGSGGSGGGISRRGLFLLGGLGAVAAKVALDSRIAAANALILPKQAPGILNQGVGDPTFPVPFSFRPEVRGGMQNKFLNEARLGEWFHPNSSVRGNRLIWSYWMYIANGSADLEMDQQSGGEGDIYLQQGETGSARLKFGIGILDRFVDSAGVAHENLVNDILTGKPAGSIPAVFMRSHPDMEVGFFNSDDGNSVASGVTSESGDIAMIVPECGRFTIMAIIPEDPNLVTWIYKGVILPSRPNVNKVDLTNAGLPCAIIDP